MKDREPKPTTETSVELKSTLRTREDGEWMLSLNADQPENREVLENLLADMGFYRDHPEILILRETMKYYEPGQTVVEFDVTEGPDIAATPETLHDLKFWKPQSQR